MAKANILISAAGWLLGFTEKLVVALKKHGVTDEAIHQLVTSKGDAAVEKIAEELAKLMERNMPNWPIWKIIYLGTKFARDADGFRKVLKAGGCEISKRANDIMGKPAFTVANQEIRIELVKDTVRGLTGKDQATYQEICQRAGERGWKLCPAEVGPQLRLQYPNQPHGEWLVIVMEPIADSDGDLRVFGVERGDSGRWLYGDCGNPESVWNGDYQFVFRK